MRLKTTQNTTHDLIDATGENLIHDAAAAHALMQAMREESVNGPRYPEEHGDLIVRSIQCRADELMREWGFDSGEVE